jgi:hypothetical protein
MFLLRAQFPNLLRLDRRIAFHLFLILKLQEKSKIGTCFFEILVIHVIELLNSKHLKNSKNAQNLRIKENFSKTGDPRTSFSHPFRFNSFYVFFKNSIETKEKRDFFARYKSYDFINQLLLKKSNKDFFQTLNQSLEEQPESLFLYLGLYEIERQTYKSQLHSRVYLNPIDFHKKLVTNDRIQLFFLTHFLQIFLKFVKEIDVNTFQNANLKRSFCFFKSHSYFYCLIYLNQLTFQVHSQASSFIFLTKNFNKRNHSKYSFKQNSPYPFLYKLVQKPTFCFNLPCLRYDFFSLRKFQARKLKDNNHLVGLHSLKAHVIALNEERLKRTFFIPFNFSSLKKLLALNSQIFNLSDFRKINHFAFIIDKLNGSLSTRVVKSDVFFNLSNLLSFTNFYFHLFVLSHLYRFALCKKRKFVFFFKTGIALKTTEQERFIEWKRIKKRTISFTRQRQKFSKSFIYFGHFTRLEDNFDKTNILLLQKTLNGPYKKINFCLILGLKTRFFDTDPLERRYKHIFSSWRFTNFNFVSKHFDDWIFSKPVAFKRVFSNQELKSFKFVSFSSNGTKTTLFKPFFSYLSDESIHSFSKDFDVFYSSDKDLVKDYLSDLKKRIKTLASRSQTKVMNEFNQKIFLWIYSNRFQLNLSCLSRLDFTLNLLLWDWACRRHKNKNKKWIQLRYFKKVQNIRRWFFSRIEANSPNVLRKTESKQRATFAFEKDRISFFYLVSHKQIYLKLKKKDFF